MLRYALTRLTSLAASLLVASLVVFVALEIVPGDPAAYMLGMNASPETVAALRTELGLDAGPVERYLTWVAGLVRGDFGISYTYRTPVAGMIADRLQVSLPLALYATRDGGQATDKDADYRSEGGLGALSWSGEGLAYLLAGEEDEATLRRLAETIKKGDSSGVSLSPTSDPVVTGSH